MADEQFPREDELESRQAAGLYPVGRALRTTFDAENHDSLGTDLTGLMLELARIDPESAPTPRGALPTTASLPTPLPAPQPAPLPLLAAEPVAAVRASWWRTALGRLLGR